MLKTKADKSMLLQEMISHIKYWWHWIRYLPKALRAINVVKIKKGLILIFKGRFRELGLKIATHLSEQYPFHLKLSAENYYFEHLFQKNKENVNELRDTVDIVIPIYNGFDYLTPLFESILKNTRPPYRLIVIDDCSIDERVFSLLKNYSKRFKHFLLLKNNVNKGFIGSVNRSVERSKSDIFVVLNSDTEVPPDWLDRLIKPIQQDPKVASATPFSNSATICSFPNFLENNDLYLGLTLDQIDHEFSSLKLLQTPITIPTGVGFCMAIRRLVVEKIGLFAPVFGRGYGEENDWCMRAAKFGYAHVLVNNLFVYHKHGGSFTTEEKEALCRENHSLLLSRHPEYDQLVHAHIKFDQAKTIRQFIKLKLISKYVNGAILVVDHNLGGGANHYRMQFVLSQLKCGRPVLVFVDDSRTESICLECFLDDEYFVLQLDEIDSLSDVFDTFSIAEVVYNDSVAAKGALKTIEIISSLKEKLKFKFTALFHDFYPICPSYTLINKDGDYCGVPRDINQCEVCLPKIPTRYSAFIPENVSIKEWRATWEQLLKKADSVICFSDNSRLIVQKAYPSISKKIKVVPHTINWKPRFKPSLRYDTAMHIGIVGGINYAKGLDVILDIVDYIKNKNLNIKVTVIGKIDAVVSPSGLTVTGSYEKDELPGLIENLGVNVCLVPSIWPETFSYVTAELMLMEVPLACFDLGAPADRVQEYEFGKVIEMGSTEKILHQLEDFMKLLIDKQAHKIQKRNCITTKLAKEI